MSTRYPTPCSYEGRRTYRLAMLRSAAQSPPSRFATPRAGQVASPRLGHASWHRISARVPWTPHRTDKSGAPTHLCSITAGPPLIRLPPPFTHVITTIHTRSMQIKSLAQSSILSSLQSGDRAVTITSIINNVCHDLGTAKDQDSTVGIFDHSL